MSSSPENLDAWMSVLIAITDPFQRATDRENARPCWQRPQPYWLSPLRRFALIEAARELNNRSAEYFGENPACDQNEANDRFRPGSGCYVGGAR